MTVSDAPELLFYVADPIQASTLEIRLMNERQKVVSQTEFLPEERGGIVSINLLDNTNNDALEFDSLYSWSVIQECAGMSNPKIITSGLVRRVELDTNLAQQLERASPIEAIKLYKSAKLWHEVIANFMRLKCHDSTQQINPRASINLENINLENIVDSENLLRQPLNSYCANSPEPGSIVMR